MPNGETKVKTSSWEVECKFIFILLLTAHLEVYDHCKNKDGGDEVHEVWQVLPVEGLSEGAHLISASGQQVKQSDDGSLKLSAWEKK